MNGPVQIARFADVVLDVGAVVRDRAIDIGAAAHEIAQLAAEAVTDRADLAVAFRQAFQVFPGVDHVLNAKVVVEIVVEIERFLHVLGVGVGKLDAGLLPPEEIGYEAHEARFREFPSVRRIVSFTPQISMMAMIAPAGVRSGSAR